MNASMRGRTVMRALIDGTLKLASARNSLAAGKSRTVALVLAVLIFAAASLMALNALPDTVSSPRWPLLALVAAVGVPAAILLNAAEYAISARMLEHRVSLVASLRISVLASAANLLPVPGSVLIRVRALTRLGSGLRRSVAATAAVGVGWVGTGSVMTGAFLAITGATSTGVPIAALGVALVTFAYALVPAMPTIRRAIVLAQIVAVEAGSVGVKAARYWLVFQAFGIDLRPHQSLALAMAAVLATALGFFPGGLGLQEVLSAAIGPLVGQSASFSVLASSVDRIISLAVLAFVTAALLRWTRSTEHESEQIALAEAVELSP